jgi:hypothetical protein
MEPPTVIIYSNTPKFSATSSPFPTDMYVDVVYLDNPALKQQQYMHRTLNTTSASPSSSAPVSPFRDSSSPVSESKKNE